MLCMQVFGKVAKTPIPPTMWSYNKNVKDYRYNPEKPALLKEAGLENGFETRPLGNACPSPLQSKRT